jgi:hypothetical protein
MVRLGDIEKEKGARDEDQMDNDDSGHGGGGLGGDHNQ